MAQSIQKKLPIECRSWVGELRSFRNKIAHIGGEDFSDADTWRALDTMVRLAEQIDNESANEIRTLRDCETTDYRAIWNEFCFQINKNRSALEQDFHKIVVRLFENLGWYSNKGEVVSEMELSDGRRPDIVIKNDGKPVYIIELKRADMNLSKSHADQLITYMLPMWLDYGVLFGSTMQMYSKSSSDDNPPAQICNIRFAEDSEAGIECLEVLSKDNFSLNRLKKFSDKCSKNQEKYCENSMSKTEVPPLKPKKNTESRKKEKRSKQNTMTIIWDGNGQEDNRKKSSEFTSGGQADTYFRNNKDKYNISQVRWTITDKEAYMIRNRYVLTQEQIIEINQKVYDAASIERFYKRILDYVDGLSDDDLIWEDADGDSIVP